MINKFYPSDAGFGASVETLLLACDNRSLQIHLTCRHLPSAGTERQKGPLQRNGRLSTSPPRVWASKKRFSSKAAFKRLGSEHARHTLRLLPSSIGLSLGYAHWMQERQIQCKISTMRLRIYCLSRRHMPDLPSKAAIVKLG